MRYDLFSRAYFFNQARHGHQQLFGPEGLPDKITESRLQRPHAVAIGVSRDGDARDVRCTGISLKVSENLPAIQFRHGKVHHDQIGRRIGVRELQAFLPVSGLANLVIRAREEQTKQLTVVVVVFGDQNRNRHGNGGLPSTELRQQATKIPDHWRVNKNVSIDYLNTSRP